MTYAASRGLYITQARIVDKPKFNKTKQTTFQRQGINYEKKVLTHITQKMKTKDRECKVINDTWFAYTTNHNTNGVCCPDIILLNYKLGDSRYNVILEIKLTYKAEAWLKVNQIYIPVVEIVYPQQQTIGLIVCKNLTSQVNQCWDEIDRALTASLALPIEPVVQWLGRPIGGNFL